MYSSCTAQSVAYASSVGSCWRKAATAAWNASASATGLPVSAASAAVARNSFVFGATPPKKSRADATTPEVTRTLRPALT